MNRSFRILLILMCLGLLYGYGCSKKENVSADDRFLGSWRSSLYKTHRIMTFRANGTWVGETRVEGRLPKIIEKKGHTTGTWTVKGDFLHLNVLDTKADSDYAPNTDYPFEILEMTKDKMRIKWPDGKVIVWNRLKGQAAGEKGESVATVGFGPIVVNLSRDRRSPIDRYMCIDLEFTLDLTAAEIESLAIHPRVKETAIFYLSSLTYRDVNTMQKINQMTEKLKNLLNPYMKGTIDDITVKNVVVTTSTKSVEEFLSGYEQKAKEGSDKT